RIGDQKIVYPHQTIKYEWELLQYFIELIDDDEKIIELPECILPTPDSSRVLSKSLSMSNIDVNLENFNFEEQCTLYVLSQQFGNNYLQNLLKRMLKDQLVSELKRSKVNTSVDDDIKPWTYLQHLLKYPASMRGFLTDLIKLSLLFFYIRA